MSSELTRSDLDTLLSMEMKLRLLDLENIQGAEQLRLRVPLRLTGAAARPGGPSRCAAVPGLLRRRLAAVRLLYEFE